MALIAALVLVSLSTLLLTKVFVGLTEVTVIVGTFASIFAFLGTTLQFAHGYEERAKEKIGPLRRRRLLSYSLFSLLGICASALLIVGTVNLVQLLSAGPPSNSTPLEVVTFRVILPLLATLLFLTLAFKVKAVRMLDFQKTTLREVGRILNDWRLPSDQLSHLGNGGPPSTDLAKSYGHLLDELCEKALLVACATGHQEHRARSLEGLTAVLFLADMEKRHFVPVAVAGGNNNYRNALDSFRPPFFDRDAFRQIYNKFHHKARAEKIRGDQFPILLTQFRKESSACISSTGLIYAMERKLVFDDNLYTKCIAFRFEFLEQLPVEDRELFQFRQLVGIPIGVFGRKVGVLLLMSSRPNAFYTNDRVFRLMGDMTGVAVQFGLFTGIFEHNGLKDLYRHAPSFQPAEALEDLIHFVNGLSHNFSRPC